LSYEKNSVEYNLNEKGKKMNKKILIFLFLIMTIIVILSSFILGDDYAIEFDGVKTYIDFGDNGTLDINSTNATGLTVEAWIKLPEYLPDQMIFSRYSWAVGGYIFFVYNGNLCFQWATPGYMNMTYDTTKISTGIWTHIAAQIDNNTGEGRLYIDGKLKLTKKGCSMPAGAKLNAQCGSVFTKGVIDELRVSNIARYTSEFTPPTVQFIPDTNTKGLWHFSEGSGVVTKDVSGNNNDGKLINGPLWVKGYYGTGTEKSVVSTVSQKQNYRGEDVVVYDFDTKLSSEIFVMKGIKGSTTGQFRQPYGLCSGGDKFPLSACKLYSSANLNSYRVGVNWREYEPQDDKFNWTSIDPILDNAKSVGAVISLLFLGSPDWARKNKDKVLSYPPEEAGEFITELLKHCESHQKGVVVAVEVENEYPTGAWVDSIPVTHGTDQRDPSWYYADILKTVYMAVKRFNPEILVIMDGIWAAAYHHLDELYQLGCKGYFDRTNLHYYVEDYNQPENPDTMENISNFPTTIRYYQYLVEQNNDDNCYLWITEFGWRVADQYKKSSYIKSVLDISRKSGFVEKTFIYSGLSGAYPTHHDRIALIYTDREANPSFFALTPPYYMYKNYTQQYPTWDPNSAEKIPVLSAASEDVKVINPGFESGDTSAWDIVESVDSNIKHTGNYSGRQNAPNKIRSKFYRVEPSKLYEIICYIKIDAKDSDSCLVRPYIVEQFDGESTSWWEPPNYWGIVDTRNYPGTWRRIRFMYLVPKNKNEIAVEFSSDGTGTFWIDDLQIKSLKLPNPK